MLSYDEICEIMLKVHPSIRYAGILDEDKVTFVRRAGIFSLLTNTENTKSAQQALMRWQTRRVFARKFGMPLYAFVEYKLVKRITMQLKGNVMLLVSMDKDAPHEKIIKKLLKTKDKAVQTQQAKKKSLKNKK